MKFSAVIVDDEESSRSILRQLLGKFCADVNIIGEAENVQLAFELINKTKPDLVFLDIQIPTGNGFTLLKKFDKIFFDVIFVTSFDQFAINAIKFSALDYLLKPIEVIDLISAVNKAKSRVEEKAGSSTQIFNLLNSIDDQQQKKIALHTQGKVRLMNINEIIVLEADVNYTHVYLQSDEKITTAKTLKEFEELFKSVETFMRISKSCILNINHITGYTKSDPSFISLSNGKEYEISRRRKQEVLDQLKRNNKC